MSAACRETGKMKERLPPLLFPALSNRSLIMSDQRTSEIVVQITSETPLSGDGGGCRGGEGREGGV